MVKTSLLSAGIINDIAQAFAARKLSDCHEYKLGPSGRCAESTATVMICEPLELMSRNDFKYLSKDRITMGHGLIPLSYKVFLVEYIVTTG